MRFLSRSLLAVALFLGAPLASFAADLKVGVIDMQKAISQSDAGREATNNLRLRAKQYQDEITNRTNALNKLREQIEKEVKAVKQGQAVPQATLDKDRDYATQARELQRLLGGYQEELKVYEAELTRKVMEKLLPVLADFANKGQYDFIFRAGEHLQAFASKHDVTEAVIVEFNKKQKK